MNSGTANSSRTEPPDLATQRSTALKRQLRGDLDNIVLKALRKEPVRRYLSVEQLAEDIRRHLEDRPVRATPDSTSYRVRKFAKRNKAGVAATALVALAVTGGVAATWWEARVAIKEQERAERRFNDVRKLANSFLFEFDEAIKNLPGSTPARSLVVKRALEYLDGLAVEARGDLSLQMDIATAYQKVAEVQGDPMYPNLGDSAGALQSSRKALAILESLARAEPANQQIRLDLASAHQQISDVLNFSGDTAGAVAQSGEALKIFEALPADFASDTKVQTERVIQTYHYANLLKLTGVLDQSTAEYRKAVELSEALIAANPADSERKVHLATSLDGLGSLLQERGDTAGAVENRRRGLIIREELVGLDPNNAHYLRQLAFSHHNVGLSLVAAGDLASALVHFKQELNLFEKLSTADRRDVQGRRNRSLAHKQIGDVLMRTHDFRGALAQYRTALQIDRDLTSVDPGNTQAILDLSFSEGKVGSALGKLGQTKEALAILQSGVARQESLKAKDPSHILLYNHLANTYTLIANCLLDSSQTKAAVEYYRKAVAARLTLSEKSPASGANRSALAECYTNLARALASSDQGDALKQYSNAAELLENLVVSDASNSQPRIALADALTNAARLYVRMAAPTAEPSIRIRNWTRARSLYQRSQQLWLELGKADKIPHGRSGAVREVSSELVICDDSLAKLQGLIDTGIPKKF